MASIIELRLPIEQFALSETFKAVSDLRIEIERFTAQDDDSAMPFAWVSTDEYAAFERAAADDPSVDSLAMLADCEDERLYRMNWVANAEIVVQILLTKGGAITTAGTNGEAWEFQIMCPDHNSISDIYEFCEENELSLTVDAIYELGGNRGSLHGLTEAQHISLLTAMERGYYEIPRSITLSDLGSELGVSHQALSEMLRRGHRQLIKRTISPKKTDNPERPPKSM